MLLTFNYLENCKVKSSNTLKNYAHFSKEPFRHKPGRADGIAAGYELDGPGIESRWGRDFPHLSKPALEPTQPPIQLVPVLSRG
jgi:hypothetical protein